MSSTPSPPPPTGGEHLDDEVLSGHLDGETTLDAHETAHLAACARCAARLEQFGALAGAVASAPPPPPARQRDDLVATALAELDGAGAQPTPLAGRRPGRTVPAPWLAAAVVILVLAASGVLLATLTGGDREETAAGDAAVAEDDMAALESGGAGLDDLGDVGSDTELRDLLAPVLTDDRPPALGDGGGEGTAAAGRSDDSDAPSTFGADDGAVAPEAAPEAGGTQRFGDGDHSGPDEADPDDLRRCLPDLAREGLDGGRLAHLARLRWQGTPALVHAYLEPDGERAVVYVTAADDCRILTSLSFQV